MRGGVHFLIKTTSTPLSFISCILIWSQGLFLIAKFQTGRLTISCKKVHSSIHINISISSTGFLGAKAPLEITSVSQSVCDSVTKKFENRVYRV